MGSTRRGFTPEYKDEAVKLVINTGRTVATVARELGLKEQTLTPTGRLRLARCVVDQGWPMRRAAELFGVSLTTAQRWSGRYRAQGQSGIRLRHRRGSPVDHQRSTQPSLSTTAR